MQELFGFVAKCIGYWLLLSCSSSVSGSSHVLSDECNILTVSISSEPSIGYLIANVGGWPSIPVLMYSIAMTGLVVDVSMVMCVL